MSISDPLLTRFYRVNIYKIVFKDLIVTYAQKMDYKINPKNLIKNCKKTRLQNTELKITLNN